MLSHLLLLPLTALSAIPTKPPTKPWSPPQSKINTVVLLVLENHSFDHIFGWLNDERTKMELPLVDGLKGEEKQPTGIKQEPFIKVCMFDGSLVCFKPFIISILCLSKS